MLDAPQAPDALARPLPPVLPSDSPADPDRPVAGDALFAAAKPCCRCWRADGSSTPRPCGMP